MALPSALTRLPLVGRSADLAELRAVLEHARAGRSSVVLLAGGAGVGKSRITTLVADEARHSGWAVAFGRGYPVESGIPFAVFADAFVPMLRDLGAAGLTVLARGSEGQLVHVFPALRSVVAKGSAEGPAGNRAELFWTFAELVKSLAARAPLLIVIEDVHWADPSSLELLHFVARQLSGEPVVIVATVNDAERDAQPTVRSALKSLESLPAVRAHAIGALGRDATAELVRHAFGVDEAVTRNFTTLLYESTRGNPYFIEESLKLLVESGRLRQQEGGAWLGWEVDRLELPSSVRDAIEVRLGALDAAAREVAELVSVVGTRTSYATMRAVTGRGDAELVDAIEQLRRHNVLEEERGAHDALYDFAHPMLAQVFHSRAGLARRRMLHARIAAALEAQYGAEAGEHAGELAHHFRHGESGDARAVTYLIAAGRSALARFANREASDYLDAALERLADDDERVAAVVRDLARAAQRLGDSERALALHERSLAHARGAGDAAAEAHTLRHMGLAHFRAGRHAQALETFALALARAGDADEPAVAGQIRLARGAALESLGRIDESLEDLRAALAAGERAQDTRLQARAHRELLVFHTMAGPPADARHHGARAIALAEASDDRVVACTCHWAMAVLEGLTGHADACARHMQRSTELAEELNSPLLRLAIDEVHVEWAYGLGAWDTGIALGERAIALARSLQQRAVLVRLLVWTGILYCGRYQIDRAREYIDEAWRLSGADDDTHLHDVHVVVPAHIGRAHYHMTLWQWDEAIEVGNRALAIVDATGARTWAVHRLLPIIAEAQLSKFDAEAARATGARLRRDAEYLDQKLGLAWADTSDAILAYVESGPAAAIPRMRAAIEVLEAVPYIPHATRLRRILAGRLAEAGDRDAAISELRRAHDTFVKLGAQWDLEKTRGQFQEVGARPPGKAVGQGAEALTEREIGIVRLVAAGKSNKAIGKALDISPRTVSTHLSNVYAKLGIGSREELAEIAPRILSAG